MNPNIKAAAQAHADHFRSGTIGDFTAGAEYFQKESGADEMAEALKKMMAHKIEKDFESDKLQPIFDVMETALAKYLSFTKKEENGK